MKRIETWKRLMGLLLVAVLLLAAPLPAGREARSAAASSAQTAEPGIVRVLLTQLQLTDRLDAALDGSYSAEPGGMAFQRGSKLVVSSAQGTLMLYYEGMAMDAGKELILRRHALTDNQENGLRLNGIYSLYTGDLHVTMKDGMLRAVLYISLEDYLKGVVPYEMSESFPLEALKAQAITARTYALRRVGGSQDYDVVDNTNDQVFKGFVAGHEQADKAVEETQGVLGYYKNQLAECYYSASNGGQTELAQHVWAGQSQGLSAIKDDPYDLENPLSVVNSFTVPKAWTAAPGAGEKLDALFKAAVSPKLAALGYDGDTAYIRITGVESVNVNTPKYEAPSRLMTKMTFTLKVSGRRLIPVTTQDADVSFVSGQTESPVPSATPAQPQWTDVLPIDSAVTVDLNIFPDVETALNLSIQGDSNEIVTVTEAAASFVIEARRFGHGVGMSQRGAQVMAGSYGWTYAQILEFYYPGITFVKTSAQAALQSPISAAFLATPGPAATPTPRPTLMPITQTPGPNQWQAKVTQIGTNSSLNLRDAPSTQGNVIRILYYGQKLLVLEELADGWLHVKTDAIEGYVMASFVEKDE